MSYRILSDKQKRIFNVVLNNSRIKRGENDTNQPINYNYNFEENRKTSTPLTSKSGKTKQTVFYRKPELTEEEEQEKQKKEIEFEKWHQKIVDEQNRRWREAEEEKKRAKLEVERRKEKAEEEKRRYEAERFASEKKEGEVYLELGKRKEKEGKGQEAFDNFFISANKHNYEAAIWVIPRLESGLYCSGFTSNTRKDFLRKFKEEFNFPPKTKEYAEKFNNKYKKEKRIKNMSVKELNEIFNNLSNATITVESLFNSSKKVKNMY